MSAHTSEADESEVHADNSLGRLLTLSDGVFAIAMTLLALDLRVPVLGDHPGDAVLRHALGQHASNYLSYVISFYVAAGYWIGHHRLMRSVTTTHPRLIRHTLAFLLLIAAIPFPAALLGRYGGTAFALALYGVFNIVVTLALMRLRHDVGRLGLLAPGADLGNTAEYVGDLAVFALCLPAGYVLGRNGPAVLLLLFVSGRLGRGRGEQRN